MILSVNGQNLVFDWENGVSLSYLPQLEYVDLNDDKKEELVVILTHAAGTGSVIQSAHVINPENLDEYVLEDPIDAIESQVEITKLSPQEEEIKIGKEKTRVNLKELAIIPPIDEMTSDVLYENYIKYEVTENNVLRAIVGVELKSLSYLGYLEIDYSFHGNRLKSEHIAFRTIQKK